MSLHDPAEHEEVLPLVQKALCEVVPERFVEPILQRATELAQEHTSDDTDRIRSFIDGPMRAALIERFGEQLARLGASQVRSALGIEKRFDSQIRGTARSAQSQEQITWQEDGGPSAALLEESGKVAEGPATKPLPQLDGRELYFVSPEAAAPTDLCSSAGQDMAVRRVSHLAKLPDGSSTTGTATSDGLRGVVIVVDCRKQPASELGFGIGAPSFGAGLVILWGTSTLLGDATRHVAQHPNWIRCGPEVEAGELGMLVRAFSTPKASP